MGAFALNLFITIGHPPRQWITLLYTVEANENQDPKKKMLNTHGRKKGASKYRRVCLGGSVDGRDLCYSGWWRDGGKDGASSRLVVIMMVSIGVATTAGRVMTWKTLQIKERS